MADESGAEDLGLPKPYQVPLKRHSYLLSKIADGSRPEAANDEWVLHVLRHFRKRQPDIQGRTRYYGYIKPRRKYLRVVVDPEGLIFNAFWDLDYTPRRRKASQ